MKNILVIGNGYDLAAGLKTGYVDFVNFISRIQENIPKDFFSANAKNIDLYQLVGHFGSQVYMIDKNDSLFRFHQTLKDPNILESILTKCINNFWVDYMKSHKNSLGDKWSDFEYVIGTVIEHVSYYVNHPEDFENENNEYIKDFIEIKEIADIISKMEGIGIHKKAENYKKKLYDDLNNLTFLLKIYLEFEIGQSKITNQALANLQVDYAVNFNYTNTFSKLNPTVDVCYIHGSIDCNDNLVFGIGKNIKYSLDEEAESDFIQFQKYYQRIVKKTGIDYKEKLDDNDSYNIVIFGHSLEIVDGDVMKDLIVRKKTKIFISYYKESGLYSLVTNLTRLFGKDEIIKYTSKGIINFFDSTDNTEVENLIKKLNTEREERLNRREVAG